MAGESQKANECLLIVKNYIYSRVPSIYADDIVHQLTAGTGRYGPLDVTHREATKVLFGQNNLEGFLIGLGLWLVYSIETYSQPNTEQDCMEILHDIIRGRQADRLQASYVVFCLSKAVVQVRSLSVTPGGITRGIMGWFDTCLQARPNIVVPTEMFVAYAGLRCRWQHQTHEIVLCRAVSPQLYVWLFFRDIEEYFSLQTFPDHSTFKSHLSSVSPIVLWLLSELRQLQLNDMDCIRSLDLLVKRILALCEATGDLAVRGTAEDNFNCDNALILFDKSLRGSAAALKRLALTAGIYQQPLGNYGQPPDTTLPACEIPKLLKRVVRLSTPQLLDLTLKHLRRNDIYFNTIKGEYDPGTKTLPSRRGEASDQKARWSDDGHFSNSLYKGVVAGEADRYTCYFKC